MDIMSETAHEEISVIKGRDVAIPHSLRMVEDPFAGQYGDGILEPPYNLEFLALLLDHSNILPQCVEAMETNIDAFGFTLNPIGKADPENDGKLSREAEVEKRVVENFFSYCNPDIPYTQVRRRTRRDIESTGNGYWEIIRNATGEISWIEHIESYTMRMTKLDAENTDVKIKIRDDAENAYREEDFNKRFRRFVQIRNGVKVYFKEFGDPRIIDSRTGRVLNESALDSGDAISPATEVIHFKLYSPHTQYGVPRWIGNLLAVLGSRQAEEVNYEYFENNTVPPLALLVSGKLGENTVKRVQDFVDDHMRGRKGFHKMLVIEASPATQPVPGMPTPKVSIQFQPLSDAQQKDALFQNYDDTNREKIRSSFRLPPIYVGLTSDYTRATAHESKSIAEEQVFAPERADHDFVINRRLFPDMNIRYWEYKSLAPDTTDVEVMANVLDIFCRCGLTVREAREEMGRLLNRTLTDPEGSEGEYLDLPLSVYIETLRVGRGATGQGEVIEGIADEGKGETISKADLFLDSLLGIRKSLEEGEENGHSCPECS
ncbi:MAG: phage portal protein [Synergistaceae bacterium]|jgi:PBSX family phage portal protein|nr:phage portal protein [Synergistaceae bacterium]